MTDEVRAAAERYRMFRNGRWMEAYTEEDDAVDQVDKDCRILADAYLAERADTGGERERKLEAVAKMAANSPCKCATCIGQCVGCVARAALAPAATQPTPASRETCGCRRCINENQVKGPAGLPFSSERMILCPVCGNKRCPHASDHRLECTHSNESGQPGSAYPTTQPTPAADAGTPGHARLSEDQFAALFDGRPSSKTAMDAAEEIRDLRQRLAAAEAEVKRLTAIPAGVGRTITRPVFPIDQAEFGDELTRRRAVPAEVVQAAEAILNTASCDIDAHYPKVLARYIMDILTRHATPVEVQLMADCLVRCYKQAATKVADCFCELDRTGTLLGYIRTLAAGEES